MARASIDKLKASRTREVEIIVDDEPVSFEIAKIKVGQQKRLMTECVDQYGNIDTDKLYCLTAQMCVVDPPLSNEDIDEIDGDVFAALSVKISEHSNVSDPTKLLVADPKEGSEAVKRFPAEDGSSGVGIGVDADQGGA